MLFNAGETKTNIRKEMADAIGVIECDKCAQIAVNQQFFNRNADRIYTRCHNRSCDAQPFINQWSQTVRHEFDKLQNGYITHSRMIDKYNCCA